MKPHNKCLRAIRHQTKAKHWSYRKFSDATKEKIQTQFPTKNLSGRNPQLEEAKHQLLKAYEYCSVKTTKWDMNLVSRVVRE